MTSALLLILMLIWFVFGLVWHLEQSSDLICSALFMLRLLFPILVGRHWRTVTQGCMSQNAFAIAIAWQSFLPWRLVSSVAFGIAYLQ